MPLHLLGKKSWNVYNRDNVERVRRDEADAQAREQAAEQRMQEADAARRIAILRGVSPPPLPPDSAEAGDDGEEASGDSTGQRKRGAADGLGRKRKRLRGEDDTDRAIRYAREDAEAGDRARRTLQLKQGHRQDDDAPLFDREGHLQLIPAPDKATVRKAEKNAEAEAEKAKKKRRDEDQYTMRFDNAAGFNTSMQQRPWYAASGEGEVSSYGPEKDVWGNEDPRRQERERNRVTSNDPFAAMQQAQRQLQQSQKDRDRWKKEREAEMEELKREEKRLRREKKKHRRREVDDVDSLEGFSLDATKREPQESGRDKAKHHRHYSHRRHRSRSPEEDGDRSLRP